MEHYQQLWAKALEILQEKISKPSFETWFKSTRAIDFQDDVLTVAVPHDFAKDWLNSRYANLIEETLKIVTNRNVRIHFVSSLDEKDAQQLSAHAAEEALDETDFDQSPKSMLNPRYTFDTFVIGSGNRFAHAASLAVAESPAKAYNPLFIYGGVGLGKTHLMHAIGHHVLAKNPSARVVYISSEKFTNEFINAIRDNRADDFRNKYRTVDILLIDDIQFLAKKEGTQEEFFHTFNTLHEENKQIIISSDRPPKEIPTLEDRLRSRFEWGLITDVQPPDLETRIAILRKKALVDNLQVPEDVLFFIADRIDTNIRELEGALIRVVAYSALMNQPITPELAEDALKDILPQNQQRVISIQDIQQAVSSYYRLRVEDLKSKKRTKTVALPRQIAMYLARELTDASLPKIGEDFGGRDHTTVIHAHEKISKMMESDPHLKQAINELIKRLNRNL